MEVDKVQFDFVDFNNVEFDFVPALTSTACFILATAPLNRYTCYGAIEVVAIIIIIIIIITVAARIAATVTETYPKSSNDYTARSSLQQVAATSCSRRLHDNCVVYCILDVFKPTVPTTYGPSITAVKQPRVGRTCK